MKTICLDLDGVLADSAATMVSIAQSLGVEASLETFTTYEPGTAWDLTSGQLSDFWRIFVDELRRIQPMQHAIQGVQSIRWSHQLLTLSSRAPARRFVSQSWLDLWSMGWVPLVLCPAAEKADWCYFNGAELLVEDCGETALLAAQAGVPTLLLDWPYNQGVAHPLITRVGEWRKRDWWECIPAEIARMA